MSFNQFNRIQVRRKASNWFDLSHDNKLSTNFGRLTPVLVKEVLPNDVWQMRSSTLVRFAPMLAPIMHNVNVFVHYFFVPNRIVWDSWEKFISPDLIKETPPAWPHFSYAAGTSLPTKGLPDYLGLPSGRDGLGAVSAIPFGAYQMIYQEYYRDENLENDALYKLVNGSNNANLAALSQLRNRSWEHDYFTSNLPFAQKGPAVNLPLGGEADIIADPSGPPFNAAFVLHATTGLPASGALNADSLSGVLEDASNTSSFIDPNGSLVADLSTATATTINDLRVAMRLQEWFELAARGGSRYTEQLRSFWNARPSDSRLNRPEFLGGTKASVIISEVLQTSATVTGETPQATMSGHGLSAANGKYIRFKAEEHGFIIGIMSILPRTAYFQGIHRQWTRQTWDDYAWPQFAHLGEQAVLNKEIYSANDSQNDATFGFLPRYSEYRTALSEVHGDFRTSLKFWHMAREFASRPNLNNTFIRCAPSSDGINRIFAVQDESDKLWCCVEHDIKVRRMLPKYGTPTL